MIGRAGHRDANPRKYDNENKDTMGYQVSGAQPVAGHWWDRLPADYYRWPDGTALDAEHPIKVRGTAAADVLLRSALGSVMVAAMAPRLATHRGMQDDLDKLAFYAPLAEAGDHARSFQAPEPVRIKASRPRFGHYRPHSIPVQDLSFESPFVPLNPDLRQRYLGYARNRQAHAQHWTHPSGPRKTLIFVHGVIEGWYGLNSIWFALKWFYRRGYDILQFTLPFHGYRTERRHLVSGFGFFADGFAHVNEAMLQGVCDMRTLMDHLFAQGVPSIGVTGLSLGGYQSAMLATADPRLAFCIPNSPVVTPIDMALDWQPTGGVLRTLMKRHGVDLQTLRRGTAVHSPLSYAPQIDGERALIIGGAGDRLTSPRFVRLLHEHWPASHLHWFPGNHVIHLRQGEYLKRMLRFMDGHTR